MHRLTRSFSSHKAHKVSLSYFGSDIFSVRVLKDLLPSPSLSNLTVYTTEINSRSKDHPLVKFCEENSIRWEVPVRANSKEALKQEWEVFLERVLRERAEKPATPGIVEMGLCCSYRYKIPESLIEKYFLKVDSAYPAYLHSSPELGPSF